MRINAIQLDAAPRTCYHRTLLPRPLTPRMHDGQVSGHWAFLLVRPAVLKGDDESKQMQHPAEPLPCKR